TVSAAVTGVLVFAETGRRAASRVDRFGIAAVPAAAFPRDRRELARVSVGSVQSTRSDVTGVVGHAVGVGVTRHRVGEYCLRLGLCAGRGQLKLDADVVAVGLELI